MANGKGGGHGERGAGKFLLQETASSPLAPLVRGLAAGPRARLVQDVEDALRGYVDDGGITFPLETWVAVARR